MIPLQFSCHNNDHTAQLSLGGHAAPSLTHTHRRTVFCECSHRVLCAIDSRHTHTHIWLSSDVSAAACQIRADGSGHEARSLLSWSCCPYTAQYTHSMTLSTSTYRTIIGTHVVVPSKPQPQTWGGCSSPVAVDFQRGADFTDSDQGALISGLQILFVRKYRRRRNMQTFLSVLLLPGYKQRLWALRPQPKDKEPGEVGLA